VKERVKKRTKERKTNLTEIILPVKKYLHDNALLRRFAELPTSFEGSND